MRTMFNHRNILKIESEKLKERFSKNKTSNAAPKTLHVGSWIKIENLENEVKTLRSQLNKKEKHETNVEDIVTRNAKLQKKVKRLQSEVSKLKDSLNEKDHTINGLVDAMIELDEHKDSWREKCAGYEKLLQASRSDVANLKCEIKQVSSDNEQFRRLLEHDKLKLDEVKNIGEADQG